MINDFLYLEDDGKKIDIYPGDNSEGLRINSIGQVELFTPSQQEPSKNRNSIFMVIGMIDILSTFLLISVVQKKLIARIDEEQIWAIQKVNITPIGTSKDLNGRLQKYIDLIINLLDNGGFYYSHTYDLTNSWQRQKNNKSQRIDKRFYWNRFVQSGFKHIPQNHQIRHYLCPIIRGYVSIREFSIQEKLFDYVLISRTSCIRTGARFEVRGANLNGDVANFVETEQILSMGKEKNAYISSFLQVRGNIPIAWEQKTNLKYDPPIILGEISNSKQAFNKHFDEQLKLYKKQTVISLIEENGTEKNLGDVFNTLFEQNKNENLKYITFDLHHICGTTKFERFCRITKSEKASIMFKILIKLYKKESLENNTFDLHHIYETINPEKLTILLDEIDPHIESYGFFSYNGNHYSQQQGVLRTNCKDSLDRTNLVQSKIALKVFWKQLDSLSSFKEKSNPHLEEILTNVWADNGDAISIQYAGTPAIGGDVSRSGGRSIKGFINDDRNCITRYFLNNFQDGAKQDSINLFLGKSILHAKGTIESQSRDEPGYLFMFITMFLFYICKPTRGGGILDLEKYVFLLLCVAIIDLLLSFGSLFDKKIGYKMVSKPSLTYHINENDDHEE